MPFTGNSKVIFSGTVDADKYSEVVDCRHCVMANFAVIISGAAGLSVTPKTEISLDGVTWAVTTTTWTAMTADGSQMQGYTNARQGNSSLLGPYMRIFLDHSAGTATVTVYIFKQEDISLGL